MKTTIIKTKLHKKSQSDVVAFNHSNIVSNRSTNQTTPKLQYQNNKNSVNNSFIKTTFNTQSNWFTSNSLNQHQIKQSQLQNQDQIKSSLCSQNNQFFQVFFQNNNSINHNTFNAKSKDTFEAMKQKQENKQNIRSSIRSIKTVRSHKKNNTTFQQRPQRTCTKQGKRRIGALPKKTYVQFLNYMSNQHEKQAQKGKSQLISQSLTQYLRKTPQDQLLQDQQQIKLLKDSLQKYTAFNNYDFSSFLCNAVMKKISKQAQLWDNSLIKTFTRNLSKLLYYISYQAYCLKQCRGINFELLLLINKDIEYYSRRLGFYKVSLKTCFDIAQLYCNQRKFQMAEQYYTRSLKLAVMISDVYSQEKAIDKMGLCAYYQGNINQADYYHRNVHNLSLSSQNLIKDNYSHQKQILKLFKEKFNVNCQFQFCKNNIQKEIINFGEHAYKKNVVKQNLNNIQKDLNQMTRMAGLRGKIPQILKYQQKIKKVGLKRYHGKLYIEPKRTKFTSRQPQNDQIMLSHKSLNRINNDWQRKRIDKQCKMLTDLLNSLTNGQLKQRFISTPTEQQFA